MGNDQDIPRGMAKDWAKTLPRADSAMKTGSARVTKELSPQTFLKNWAATVTFALARSSLLMAANYIAVSRRTHRSWRARASTSTYICDIRQYIEHRDSSGSKRRGLPQCPRSISNFCQDLFKEKEPR